MPNLIQPSANDDVRIEFVASVPLDLVNAMCFTALAGQLDGLPDTTVATRQAMDPALREELDFLFGFPGEEWGVLGSLVDVMMLHPETWGSLEALLAYVRDLPAGGDGTIEHVGIQGLALLAAPCAIDAAPARGARRTPAQARREVAAAAEAVGRDAKEALALFDDPEQVRARLLRLLRRFYDEHYRPDEARRWECMQRTADARNGRHVDDIDDLLRELTGRNVSCIKDAPGEYKHHVFVPSLDVGPYSSCADFPPVHGVFFRCEPRFMGVATEEYDAASLALVYRALADEQRLRILRLLHEGELYAQEIVARTGLHQSVVSRHLSFLKAVNLVTVRRQNNMKFYALNPTMRERLAGALEALLPSPRVPFGRKAEGRLAHVE
jgi:DNA-binding transcriptional ArsR family regulator